MTQPFDCYSVFDPNRKDNKPHAVEGPHLNSTEPQHLTQPNHAHEDHSPPRSRYQAATPHTPLE